MKTRTYTPRVNEGGNFCGHSPDAPRLDLVKPTTAPGRSRPKILQTLEERIERYYRVPTCLPSLRAANRSKTDRQQRSERREACLVLLKAILEFTDLSSLRCGIPTSQGFVSLTLPFLAGYTGLRPRRAERALADLKRSNILSVSQPRELKDGQWKGLAAIKAVSKLLFSAFGLGSWLEHERARATARLAKKAAKAGGTVAAWARNKLTIKSVLSKRSSRGSKPAHFNDMSYLKARAELLQALKEAYPDMPPDQRGAEADRILQEKFNALAG